MKCSNKIWISVINYNQNCYLSNTFELQMFMVLLIGYSEQKTINMSLSLSLLRQPSAQAGDQDTGNGKAVNDNVSGTLGTIGESRFDQLRASFQNFREQNCLRSPVKSDKVKYARHCHRTVATPFSLTACYCSGSKSITLLKECSTKSNHQSWTTPKMCLHGWVAVTSMLDRGLAQILGVKSSCETLTIGATFLQRGRRSRRVKMIRISVYIFIKRMHQAGVIVIRRILQKWI